VAQQRNRSGDNRGATRARGGCGNEELVEAAAEQLRTLSYYHCYARSSPWGMLHANKRYVQLDLKVQLLGLRKKELLHFSNCCRTLGQPAALLAGFAYTGITASVAVPRGTHWLAEVLYYVTDVAAMLLLIHVTVRALMITTLGPTLALRGMDAESTHRATEEMEVLYVGMWVRFMLGSVCWMCSTVLRIFVFTNLILASIVGAGIVCFMVGIVWDMSYIARKFAISTGTIERGNMSTEDVSGLSTRRRAAMAESKGAVRHPIGEGEESEGEGGQLRLGTLQIIEIVEADPTRLLTT